ncbi:nucleoside triphosphate pyrophosphohydrolase [Desulfovibrio litoralis]|uniref:ATP diphosphatase n=1 Tax=Desulfovibrio litoralis DSM 11393 TaxID=1121455 RepID=A0A1M7SB08_9BACT|nr:nucleoside triphosphate pyrophosphohydrolase [Desulfovibrio litoralis]SHN55643.1 ATP diphosphatase [Desulfovibrio litoralis DSM 11393]
MLDDNKGLAQIQEVLDKLLGENGCPWDKEQTPEKLCDYVVEEVYELIDSIHSDKAGDIKEELGDVLFLLIFIATIYKKRGLFSLGDALQNNAAKMIARHPHVFSDASFANKEELLKNWERIKKLEKEEKDPQAASKPKGLFDSLPRNLPPLIQAYRINSKAANVGFTWDSSEDVEQQVEAEWLEWLEVSQSLNNEFVSQNNEKLPDNTQDAKQVAMEEEFGDLLFSLIELGRRKGIKANTALQRSNAKFLRRFTAMEELARKENKEFNDLDITAKEALWQAVKESEKK